MSSIVNNAGNYMYHDFSDLEPLVTSCRTQILYPSVKYELYLMYRRADKFLARPGRKQATATEDFEFHISYL
jgi:hypothetical protein